MVSQITKDFQMKSKLRKLADGGSPNPSMLGTGTAARAGGLLAGRGHQIDAAVDAAAMAPAPAPAPAPARAPQQVAQAPKKSGLRSMFGFADGGSLRPEDITGGTATSIFTPGEMKQFNAMGSEAMASGNAEAAQAVGAGRAEAAQAAAAAAKEAAQFRGFADGGSYLDGGYNANRYQQSQLRDGGRVKGPGGRTDDKVGPVMLSDEEYVLPGDTADAIGRDKLDAMRLATHDFKDGRKESALRGRADGGDGWYDDMLPMDHLADGGNPWIVDSKGTVLPNSSGGGGNQWTVDSKGTARPNAPAAGPGYQQGSTAVGPARTPPMGQRPPINMGMAEEVPRSGLRQLSAPAAGPTAQPWSGAPPKNPNVGPAGSKEAQAFRKVAPNSFGVRAGLGAAEAAGENASLAQRAGRALRTTGGVLSRGAGVVGAGLAAKDMYNNGVNVGNSGDLLASGATFAGPVGAAGAAGWGVGRAIDAGMSEGVRDVISGTFNQGIRNVGNLFGQDWGVDDSALLQQKAEARLAASKARTAPAAAASPTSALRSDQGPAQPVAPSSYQSRRLSEMGVPLDVQNSKPVVDSVTGNTRDFLRAGGTGQYQNLGTYGGNGNIYGKADNPSHPGRINNFVGVGAGASPSNEVGNTVQSPAAAAITSALRGLGSGPSAPGGSNSGGDDSGREINDRYDKLAKELRGMYSAEGQGNLARRLLDLEQLRASEQGNIRTNDASRANAQLTADTSRGNAELIARTNMLEYLSRMETGRDELAKQAQAAQRKAVEDAQKYNDIRQDKGEAATRDWIKGRFTSLGPDKKQVFDSGAAAKFTDFLGSGKAMVGPPEDRRPLMSLPPQERLAALPEVYQDWSVNEAINADGGLVGGGRTTNSPSRLVARPPSLADLANGLPASEYLGAKLVPGYESNVVERSADRKVRSVEALAGDDLERKKAILRNAGKE